MSPNEKLKNFAKQVGCKVRIENSVLALGEVPCVLHDGKTGKCTIEKPFDQTNDQPTNALSNALHVVRVKITDGAGSTVYNSDMQTIGRVLESNEVGGWSLISLKKGTPKNPIDDETVSDLVLRYAKQIVGAAYSVKLSGTTSGSQNQLPFNIPNTFEPRSDLTGMHDKIRDSKVTIIGMGGTGSFLLDLLVKTPIAEIHVVDQDSMDWHNYFRAPGSPTEAEVELQRHQPLEKVRYHSEKYLAFRGGVYGHQFNAIDSHTFSEFLTSHSIDFAFVCIDQRRNDDSPRQDEVYQTLSNLCIPFVDSGISITMKENCASGAITTSWYENGSTKWTVGIPNAKIVGDNRPRYQNVQLPEVNALAAAFAVMEWRRRTNQYELTDGNSFLHRFRIENAKIVWSPKNSTPSS